MHSSRKRSRRILDSDDETPSQSSTEETETPATSASASVRTFRTKPPNDAKFWVESTSLVFFTNIVPPFRSRKPLSTIDNNAKPKTVQLSLNNFFSLPKKKENTHGGRLSSTSITIPTSPSNESGSLENDDTGPPNKRKKLITVKDTKSKPRCPAVQRKLGASATPRPPRQAADQSDLPPIASIPKMFDDLVTRAAKLDKVVDRLNGRKLRVATMCSGTEAPLLALRMITRSLFKQTGKKLEIEHIFSCEIEPFKQAYIERNFSPPILFRDVLELANDYALVHSLSDANFQTHCVWSQSRCSWECGHTYCGDIMCRLLPTQSQQKNDRSEGRVRTDLSRHAKMGRQTPSSPRCPRKHMHVSLG